MLMRCLRCGVCCQETEMLLSKEDIERLERNGYDREFFVRIDEEGYAVLRNQNGHCVFLDPEKRVCKERSSRPSGCRIYPVIQDKDKRIIVDGACTARTTISEKQRAKRAKKVRERMDAEASCTLVLGKTIAPLIYRERQDRSNNEVNSEVSVKQLSHEVPFLSKRAQSLSKLASTISEAAGVWIRVPGLMPVASGIVS